MSDNLTTRAGEATPLTNPVTVPMWRHIAGNPSDQPIPETKCYVDIAGRWQCFWQLSARRRSPNNRAQVFHQPPSNLMDCA
jgi:hypothetical protein